MPRTFVSAGHLLLGTLMASVGVTGISVAHADIAVAWGANEYGELGDGTTTDRNKPTAVVGLSNNVTAVATGYDFSVALQNGGAYAWGRNVHGQLGDGTMTNHSTPAPVTGLSSGVTAIASGFQFNLALQNGGVYAWGFNPFGQLGNSTDGQHNSPAPVVGLSTGVTAIAAGLNTSMAVQNGAVYAWGWGGDYQMGNGIRNSYNWTPIAVAGLTSGVTAVAGGDEFCMAVKNGCVYTWGRNRRGELGIGLTPDYSTTPTANSLLTSGVTAVAAGVQYALAVRNGFVYAWGANDHGQLGNGNTYDYYGPQLIDPIELHSIVAVTSLTASSYALSSDGSLWVWGDNTYGQLGLGTAATQYLTPQHLLPPTGYAFTSVEAGGYSGPGGNSGRVVATLTAVPEPGGATLSVVAIAAVFTRRRHGDGLIARFNPNLNNSTLQ